MDENQRLHSKQQGSKGSVTKLTAKVEDIISTDLESISNESVTEFRKLMASTTLAQLRAKCDQIAELDAAIAARIETEAEFEEETIYADTYQFSLEERIAFLTEFVGNAGLPPPRLSLPLVSSAAVLLPTLEVDTSVVISPKATTHTEPAHMSSSDAHDTVATSHMFQNVSGMQKFNYLCTQLHGSAARVIAGFPLTDTITNIPSPYSNTDLASPIQLSMLIWKLFSI